MKVVRDGKGTLMAIELSEAEMRELVALEATRTVLAGGPQSAYSREARIEFLRAAQRYYDLPDEAVAPFVEAGELTRAQVLELQILKREGRGDAEAVARLKEFRALEAKLGDGILKIYVDRSQRYAMPPEG